MVSTSARIRPAISAPMPYRSVRCVPVASTSAAICARTAFIFTSSADVIQVLAGKLQAHRTDRVDRAQLGQQLLGPAHLEPTTRPARDELAQQPMQATDRLRAQREGRVAPVAEQPQTHQRVIGADRSHAGAVQRGQADGDRVIRVGLAAMTLRVDPDPSSELGRHVEHPLTVTDQPLRQ
jgi:hypothetical protein